MKSRWIATCTAVGLVVPLLGMVISCHQAGDVSAVPKSDAPSHVTVNPNPTSFECRWTDTPITIDGRADEEAWKHAQTIDNFALTWKQGNARKPREATRAKLLWDREYLYYYAEMDDHDLFAKVTEHNGPIWTDDAFELFFKPDDHKPGYYEFEVNPLNATMELFLPSRDSGGWVKYKGQAQIAMKTAVQIHGTLNQRSDQDKGWSVEGRIPWRDLSYTNGRPNIGEVWKFNACRVNVSVDAKEPELTTCAPLTEPSYHRYEDYATLKFVRPDAGGPATAPAAANVRPYGIDRYIPWTRSTVVSSPDPALPFTVAKAFPKLKVVQPLAVFEEPGTDDCLVLQHLGSWSGPSQVLRFKNTLDAEASDLLLKLDYLVYGMTLHPDFIHNGYIYLLANGPSASTHKQDRILRYAVDRNAPRHIDIKSEQLILEWPSDGHNGGDLAFGPDGYLYHASGDGTSDSDRDDRGQNTHFLTSKMIRIDVEHPQADKAYTVPKDNPWINNPDFPPEAWAYGFRNPWRIAFDRKNGNLWVGQNGQDQFEQVYLVHKGENYGWSRFEGSHPFQPLRKAALTPITFPIVEHPHSEMRSLTGGVVYRGKKYPELDGAFIYGDWSTGRIWGVKSDDSIHASWHKELARTTLQISGFRETEGGDILILDQGGAAIYKLVPNATQSSPSTFPHRLSQTGLFISTARNQPDPSLIPYDVNSPLWSDGAFKERFIALPGDGHIGVTASRAWDFPEATVLVKTFALEMEPGKPATRKRIETRLLTKQLGQWVGYTYLWSDDQSDAELLDAAGLDKTYQINDASAPNGVRNQTWHFPSRTECMTCHSRAMGFVLGASTLQLNRDIEYPNGVQDNQLRTLEHLGLLRVDYMSAASTRLREELKQQGKTDPQVDDLMHRKLDAADQRENKPGANTLLAFDPDHMDRLPNPFDAHADINLRARSYLHSNCAICHIEAGGGNAKINLEYGVDLASCKLLDVVPQHDAFGKKDAKIIAAGRPDQSILLHRISLRSNGQMPPLGSLQVDKDAVKLLGEWIGQLPASPQVQP